MPLTATDIGVKLGGRPVLDHVSVGFEPGQVTAIVGPNGAGKSTLLSCLAGLQTPDQGAVRLDGEPVLALNARRRSQQIAFLEQSPQIAWAVDVRTLVGLGRTPYLGATGPGAEDHAAVQAALDLADLESLADRIVTTLSGGERSRVLLARALAGGPQWLLADEPMAGLDPGHQLDAAQLLRRLAGQGRGVILTLHDLTLAARAADRVIVLHRGGVLADGPPRTALTREVLAIAYGVEAALVDGLGGMAIEIVGRLA